MGFLGGWPARALLARFGNPERAGWMDGSVYANRSKIEVLLGQGVWDQIRGRTVMDFGCGEGVEAVELALHGASHVVGVDIVESALERARQRARESGVYECCTFTSRPDRPADVIVALDSFEHFERPAEILLTMNRYLAPEGEVLISFGPTWLHPLGGHLFSVFPWAHLVFTERALIQWRSAFKTDGATRFSEVAGGLNQMTISRFLRLVRASPFRFAHLDLRPIRRLAPIHNRLTREFTTSSVRCTLVRR